MPPRYYVFIIPSPVRPFECTSQHRSTVCIIHLNINNNIIYVCVYVCYRTTIESFWKSEVRFVGSPAENSNGQRRWPDGSDVRERCKNDKLVKPRVTPVSAFSHKGDECVCVILLYIGTSYTRRRRARNTQQTYTQIYIYIYDIIIYTCCIYSNLSIICIDSRFFFIYNIYIFFVQQFEDRSRLSFSFHG